MRVRLATTADAPALARIYNHGLEDRTATFETVLRSEHDVIGWFDGLHPIVVVVDEEAQDVIAFARSTQYRARECYRGVFEFSVYTDREHRRRGAGLLAMRELVTRAREAGAWKLLSRIFVENEASRALVAAVGFREVGTYYRHAKLDDQWRDVVIVEKFLAPIEALSSVAPKAGERGGSRADVLATLRQEAGDGAALAQALDWARAMVDSFRRTDADLLDAVADAFFATKAHPAAHRSQFVELFRAYAALSADASRDVYALLFSRLALIPLAADLDAFYEALFVVKQIARGADQALAPHADQLVEWMRLAVELPSGLRRRISPGNVASLLMTLAASAGASNEQRHEIAELAVIAKLRHRVDAPASLQRTSVPPAPSVPPSSRPHRSLPPPLPPRRAPSLVPEDLAEADTAIPLSSQDLLPYSSLDDLPTPVVAFEPIPLDAVASEPSVRVMPESPAEPLEPTSKRGRQPKKAGAAKKPKKRPAKGKKAP